LFASYGESNRAPSAAELACADPDQPCRVPNGFISDPPLDQVVSRSLELGVRTRMGESTRPWFAGSFAVFGTRNQDDILFVAGSRVGTGYFRNAGSTQRVSVVLSSLSAAVHYFAHVVVSSPTGRVSSPDVAFTTLTTSKVIRIAAAGDIACDPNEPNFNGGQGTATACRQFAVSSAILAGGYDAVLPLGDEQYNAGSASAFAASYHPSWGRLDSIAHPVVVRVHFSRRLDTTC